MIISKDMYVNEGIRARELRLIDHNGDQLGLKTRNEALEIATRVNLDLVLVAPQAKPPVARIMDYGKFKFEQQKKDREIRKNQNNTKECSNGVNEREKSNNTYRKFISKELKQKINTHSFNIRKCTTS